MTASLAGSLRARDEWRLIRVLKRADPLLSALWWLLLVARGILPALFAIAMGLLIGAVQAQGNVTGPLVLVGTVFVLVQVLSPLHLAVSANLGSRTAAWLYDELTKSCVSPPGMAHLEDPELINDLTMARDFDLGISGPPLSISMDFIASGLVELLAGFASAVVLAGARRCVARDPLAVARERRVEGPQHRSGPRCATPCRLRLSVGRRCAVFQGATTVRIGEMDR